MSTMEAQRQSRLARLGWAVLLAMSAFLVFGGIAWFFAGPEGALTNIAERAGLDPNQVRQDERGAFRIITLITRNMAAYWASLGLMALLVAWHGFRRGSRWAWRATWALVAGSVAVALNFLLAGGISVVDLGYLGLAAVALAAQLLASRGLAD